MVGCTKRSTLYVSPSNEFYILYNHINASISGVAWSTPTSRLSGPWAAPRVFAVSPSVSSIVRLEFQLQIRISTRTSSLANVAMGQLLPYTMFHPDTLKCS